MATTTLVVEGMMCQKNCGTSVENALRAVPGVVSATASFKKKQAVVVGSASPGRPAGDAPAPCFRPLVVVTHTVALARGDRARAGEGQAVCLPPRCCCREPRRSCRGGGVLR